MDYLHILQEFQQHHKTICLTYYLVKWHNFYYWWWFQWNMNNYSWWIPRLLPNCECAFVLEWHRYIHCWGPREKKFQRLCISGCLTVCLRLVGQCRGPKTPHNGIFWWSWLYLPGGIKWVFQWWTIIRSRHHLY